MPQDRSQPLTRTLALKPGGELRALHDVAEVFLRRFGNVRHDHAVGHAIELMKAVETGSREDRKAATGQVALVLRANGMM
jgi:hypothetical protein